MLYKDKFYLMESANLLLLQKKRMEKYDVIIAGGGASGLLAAIRAGELGLRVLILEKMNRAARKLMITGKGRCNITNNAEIKDFISNIYPDGRFLYPAFKRFFSNDIIQLFGELGVETMLERGGRYFPVSNEAAEIVNALLNRTQELGVEILYNASVKKLLTDDGKTTGVVYIKNAEEQTVLSDNVIICTGGKSYPGTGSSGDGYRLAKQAGHTVKEALPALVPLETMEKYAFEMQGLTLKNVTATLKINGEIKKKEFGDLLFTHFGLSGPIILTLSRWVVEELEKCNKIEIIIDLKPALDIEKLDNRLLRDIDEHGKKKSENLFRLWLPLKAVPVFMNMIGIDPEKPANQISGKERKRIIQCLKNLEFTITGHRGFKEAIITNGGVSTDEVNQKTMESKFVKGLYFAGEVLNLDANTGGYNLQIAFSTGWLAAESICGLVG
jgi:predicted Rossmann fold flavoprotein